MLILNTVLIDKQLFVSSSTDRMHPLEWLDWLEWRVRPRSSGVRRPARSRPISIIELSSLYECKRFVMSNLFVTITLVSSTVLCAVLAAFCIYGFITTCLIVVYYCLGTNRSRPARVPLERFASRRYQFVIFVFHRLCIIHGLFDIYLAFDGSSIYPSVLTQTQSLARSEHCTVLHCAGRGSRGDGDRRVPLSPRRSGRPPVVIR